MTTPPQPTDEPAHDVLAAEAFAVPTADPSLHHGPVRLPDDPTGIVEPHDILAAEEFAIPAATVRSALARHARSSWRTMLIAVAAALVAVAAARVLRRR